MSLLGGLVDIVTGFGSSDPGSNPPSSIKPPVSATTYTICMVTMSGWNPTPPNPSPPQDYPTTPDDGRGANWSKRRVQSYTPDEDGSPNNTNTFRRVRAVGIFYSGSESKPEQIL